MNMLLQGKEHDLVLRDQIKVYVWDGVVLYVAKEHSSNTHAHFPAVLQIGLGTTFAVTLNNQVRTYYDMVLIAPNVVHSTDSENQPYMALLIDPDNELYRYLHPLLKGESVCSLSILNFSSFSELLQHFVAGNLSLEEVKLFVVKILSTLNSNSLPSLPWDIRVLQACHYIRQIIPWRSPTIAQIAIKIGLSESRLMHLFSQQLGISIRRYILWLRIHYTMMVWGTRHNLIDIALEAGFSDQAHYTRTLRSMVDFSPSILKSKANLVRDLNKNVIQAE